MEDKQLLDFITSGLKQERRDKLMRVFPGMVSSCPQFSNFVDYYRNKIHSKLANAASDEDFDDIFFEISVAHQVLSNLGDSIDLMKYEECRNNGGADFKITFDDGFVCNVEVKCIREYPPERAFNDLFDYLMGELSPPLQNISINLSMCSFDRKDLIVPRQLYDEQYREDLLCFIRSQIDTYKRSGQSSANSSTYYGLINIEIKQYSGDGFGANSFTRGPIPLYNNAKDKIAEKIREALPQVVKDEANLIVIGTQNLCYDRSNFFDAVKIIPNEFDENSGFKFVSCILYKGLGGNEVYLWFNENANIQFPADIRKKLESLFRPT